MKLTFLGTAAAEGFPNPFCACANCTAARAEGGPALRMRSAAIINDDLLIDLGPDIMSSALKLGRSFTPYSYALQTHPHGDHLAEMTLSARSKSCRREGLDTAQYVCAQPTIARMDHLMGLAARGQTFADPATQEQFALQIRTITPWEAVELGPYRIQSVAANHDMGVEAMLYAIEDTERGGRLFYGTDTGPLPAETWPRLAALGWTFDILVLDHTFGFLGRSGGHLNQEQFLEEVDAARAAGVAGEETRAYATHIGHHSHPTHGEFAKRAAERGYLVAYDGLTIDTADTGVPVEKTAANA